MNPELENGDIIIRIFKRPDLNNKLGIEVSRVDNVVKELEEDELYSVVV